MVTDEIPNGLCPLGAPGVNYVTELPQPLECTGSATHQSSVPFSSVVQNADGTFTVVFDPLPTTIPVNGSATVTYWAGMRAQYTGGPEQGLPTSSGD